MADLTHDDSGIILLISHVKSSSFSSKSYPSVMDKNNYNRICRISMKMGAESRMIEESFHLLLQFESQYPHFP